MTLWKARRYSHPLLSSNMLCFRRFWSRQEFWVSYVYEYVCNTAQHPCWIKWLIKLYHSSSLLQTDRQNREGPSFSRGCCFQQLEGNRWGKAARYRTAAAFPLSVYLSSCMFSFKNRQSRGGLTLMIHWLADTHSHTKTNTALCHAVRSVCRHVVN